MLLQNSDVKSKIERGTVLCLRVAVNQYERVLGRMRAVVGLSQGVFDPLTIRQSSNGIGTSHGVYRDRPEWYEESRRMGVARS